MRDVSKLLRRNMNQLQYKIVKTITNFPKADTAEFAAMLKIDHSEVLRVQQSSNFEQYRLNDTPAEDLMSMFGGVFGPNPFGNK